MRQLGLDLADINVVSLAAKKKELLLEIQLSEKQSIVLNEEEYSKNDVLQLFENFSDPSELEFHRKITENEHLLRRVLDGI